MDLKPGDKVLYVPCAKAHGRDKDARDEFLFNFAHAKDCLLTGAKKGDAADPGAYSARLYGAGGPAGPAPAGLHPQTFDRLVLAGPKSFWPGVLAVDPAGWRKRALAALAAKGGDAEKLRESTDAALAETCRLAGADVAPPNAADDGLVLNVPHPSGCWTLHYPVGACVKYDAGKGSHSFHAEGA